ncbi:tetratricopeptide repeat protein [Saccharicrinis sp. FJH62]|uniref:tetratricopeptide repeat protein n=1 Tax=Saccharicrinis sp. FJH62 TaxID=3344657 RepID=UPI0035D41F82
MRTKIALLTLLTGLLSFSINAQTLEEHLKKGVAYMNQTKNEEALSEFKQAIALDEDKTATPLLYSYAGICAKAIGQDNEAKGYFQTSIDRGVDDSEVFNLLGDICRDQDDMEGQIKTYSKAMEVLPSMSKDYGEKLAYVYYKAKKYPELEKLTTELLKDDPDNQKLMRLQAVSLQKNKKINEAKAVYEKILEKDPDDLSANVFMGNYYYQVGKSKLDREEAAYKKNANPDRVQWSNYQKKCKVILDDYYVKAVGYLEKAYAQKEDPNLKKLLYAAYFKLGDRANTERFRDQ